MVYVISGGPGFGKTTILKLLGERGFPVCPENARSLLIPLLNADGSVRGISFPPGFEKSVADERVNFLSSIDLGKIAFADRGLPDQIAYSWHKKKEPSPFLEELVISNRYAPFVFLTPPWQEIYLKDEIRQEEFGEASEIHQQIVKAYLYYGYKIVNLPLAIPEVRVRFILNFLGI